MFVDFNILNQLGSPAINSNTFANRPAAGQTGRLFVSTDTFEIYRDNGTSWDLIGGPGAGTITGTGTATQVAYFTGSQTIGSSANLFWDNTAGALGINTATPGAELDVHGTGIMVQLNSTTATANSLLAFQRSGTGLWRIGDVYNGGTNYFEVFNTVLSTTGLQMNAATNKTEFLAQENYTTGQAQGNLFTYNLTVPGGTTFTSPNAIHSVNSYLNLSLGGNITTPAGTRQGLEGNSRISFTGAGTLTMTQGSTVRAWSSLSSVYSFNGSAVGTITHLAGLRVCFPDNTGSAVNITNNYGLLINDQTAGTGTINFTNRWGIYQEGASDLNYFNGSVLVKTTTNAGFALDVTGGARATTGVSAGTTVLAGFGQATRSEDGVTNNNYFSTGQDIIFSSNRFRSNFLSPSNRLVLSTQNIANRTVALLFGIDALQLDAGITFDNNTRTVSLINSTGNTNSSTYTPRLNVFTSGNVAIGTTTDAGYRLDCNGTARVQGLITTTGGVTSTGGLLSQQTGTNSGRMTLLNLRNTGGGYTSALNSSIAIAFTNRDSTGVWSDDFFELKVYNNGATTSTTGYNFYTHNNQAFGGSSVLAMSINGQSVGIGIETPNASAILQTDSTTKGFLPPRMTTAEKNLIAAPANGLVIYDTTLAKLCVFTGVNWETVTSV